MKCIHAKSNISPTMHHLNARIFTLTLTVIYRLMCARAVYTLPCCEIVGRLEDQKVSSGQEKGCKVRTRALSRELKIDHWPCFKDWVTMRNIEKYCIKLILRNLSYVMHRRLKREHHARRVLRCSNRGWRWHNFSEMWRLRPERTSSEHGIRKCVYVLLGYLQDVYCDWNAVGTTS